ncbi:MAG: hypothetical protein AB1779_11020, partial [Candidatus Thermoplasmatota archaeon]
TTGTYISPIKDTGISNTPLEWLEISWSATLPAGSSIKFNTRTSADSTSWTSWSSDYTSSPSSITSQSNRYIQYRAILSTTDISVVPILSDVTITYNRKAQPPNLSFPYNNSFVETLKPTFQLYSNDDDLDVITYKIELSKDNFSSIFRVYDSSLAGWSSPSYPSGSIASYTVQGSDALREGYYYWRAYANDGSGYSSVSPTYYFGIDASGPFSSVKPLKEYINKTSFNVEWGGYDTVSGIRYYDIQYSNDSVYWINWLEEVTFTSAEWKNTTDGNKVYFRARAIDNNGNLQQYSNKPDAFTTVDVTPPISKIESLSKYQKTDTILLRWSGSDATSGIESYSIYVSENDGEYKLFLNTTSNYLSFKGLDGIKYSFYSIAIDKAGNIEEKISADTETTIDFIPPKSVMNKLPEYQNKEKFEISWLGNDEVSGILKYAIYVAEDNGNYTKFIETKNNSAIFNGTHGHTYSFYSIATDNAGNMERKISGETTTFVDVIAPTSYVFPLPSYHTSESFRVYWYGEDNGSGIYRYNIYVSEDNGEYKHWLKNVESTSELFNGFDGHNYSFYSIAIDKAGNIEPKAPKVEAKTTIDTSPPWAYVHALPRFTNSSTFLVNWSGGDLTGNISTYTIYVSDNETPYYIWLDNVTVNSSYFNGKDGHTYKFIAMGRDSSGNVFHRPFIADTFTTVDISAPIVISVLINYGANTTSSLIVKLSIKAYDEVSGLSKISFSNDNNIWSDWEFYSEEKPVWDLSAYGGNRQSGEKVVYVRVMDNAGNIGYGVSRFIAISLRDIITETIAFSQNPVLLGSTITIYATVINNAPGSLENVMVGFYAENGAKGKIQIGIYTIPELLPGIRQKIAIVYEPK